MAFCVRCGQQLNDNVKFCPNCGIKNNNVLADDWEKRETEYAGKINKCPACGAILSCFIAICPACGNEINSTRLSSALKEFAKKIDECDKAIADSPKLPKKGWASWSKGSRICWVLLNILLLCVPLVLYLIFPLFNIGGKSLLSSEEKQKVAYIENMIFPNDRESILEALLFIKAKLAFLSSEKYHRSTNYWANVWFTKAQQLHEKARLLLRDDKIATDTYSSIVTAQQSIHKAALLRAIVGSVIAAGCVLLLFIRGGAIKSTDLSSSFEWPMSELSSTIPQPVLNKGKIWNADDRELWVDIEDFSISQFESYISECEEKGFIIEATRNGNKYEAYNKNDAHLELNYVDYSSGGVLTISMNAPPNPLNAIVWPDLILGNMLIQSETCYGEVINNDGEMLNLDVYGISSTQYQSYVTTCIDEGFIIDAETDGFGYNAFNGSGYHLTLAYSVPHKMNIFLEAPMEMETIQWPKSEIVKSLPVPISSIGSIYSDSEELFTVYVGETSKEQYNAYVDACWDKGFNVDHHRYDKSFFGDNEKGYHLRVEYNGFNVMTISVNSMY